MKITAIIPYPVWVGTRNQMLVKVETDQGIFGWGESGLSGRERAVAGAIEHYREFLIGRDPIQTDVDRTQTVVARPQEQTARAIALGMCGSYVGRLEPLCVGQHVRDRV